MPKLWDGVPQIDPAQAPLQSVWQAGLQPVQPGQDRVLGVHRAAEGVPRLRSGCSDRRVPNLQIFAKLNQDRGPCGGQQARARPRAEAVEAGSLRGPHGQRAAARTFTLGDEAAPGGASGLVGGQRQGVHHCAPCRGAYSCGCDRRSCSARGEGDLERSILQAVVRLAGVKNKEGEQDSQPHLRRIFRNLGQKSQPTLGPPQARRPAFGDRSVRLRHGDAR
mmetsp:Transcript_4967/g.11620  ORF Transcript_4967/g.11620 Transcript_4967/m.11620 type:complete len:221 (+) Transcript_4967:178-840(+)